MSYGQFRFMPWRTIHTTSGASRYFYLASAYHPAMYQMSSAFMGPKKEVVLHTTGPFLPAYHPPMYQMSSLLGGEGTFMV